MNALHPSFLVAGLGIGALAALVGWRWPAVRGGSLAAGAVVAVVVMVARTRTPPGAVALPAGAAAAAFASAEARARRLARVDGYRGRPIGAAWLLVALLIATLVVYLSVADTEGAVLVGALIGAGGAPWVLARWQAPAPEVALATGALAGAVVASGVGSTWTPGGWLAVKAAAVALYAAAFVAHRRHAVAGVTSERERPSP